MNQLPADVEEGSEDEHSVVDKEVPEVPRVERGVAVAEDDDNHPDETEVTAIRLEAAVIWEVTAIEVLRFASVIEADVGDAHHNVIDHTTRRYEVDEPL